jgi:hypothetical protein
MVATLSACSRESEVRRGVPGVGKILFASQGLQLQSRQNALENTEGLGYYQDQLRIEP